MSMIPTAQVLCDILNDPAIPAEAKPEWCREWLSLGQNVIVSNEHITFLNMSRLTSAELENKELFWSLSVWLWERSLADRCDYSIGPIVSGGFLGCKQTDWLPEPMDGTHMETPVQALAAVVRAVASRDTLPP